MTLQAPPDLPEDPADAGMELADWRKLLDEAEARIPRSLQAVREAEERAERTRSLTAHADAARARRTALHAERNALLLRSIWDTSGRPNAVLAMRLEKILWREDGAVPNILTKGKGGALRMAFLLPQTTSRLRAWRANLEPSRRLPDVGWVWPGRGARGHLCEEALDEIVHDLALAAGIQRYRPGGQERASHKFVVTPGAVRTLAEATSIDAGCPPDVAALAADHTRTIQQRHYGQRGADHARRAAQARAFAV